MARWQHVGSDFALRPFLSDVPELFPARPTRVQFIRTLRTKDRRRANAAALPLKQAVHSTFPEVERWRAAVDAVSLPTEPDAHDRRGCGQLGDGISSGMRVFRERPSRNRIFVHRDAGRRLVCLQSASVPCAFFLARAFTPYMRNRSARSISAGDMDA